MMNFPEGHTKLTLIFCLIKSENYDVEKIGVSLTDNGQRSTVNNRRTLVLKVLQTGIVDGRL